MGLWWVVWPSGLAAALLEAVVFAAIDPADLPWFGRTVPLSATGVYSVVFFVFWSATTAASAMTLWLSSAPQGAAVLARPAVEPVNGSLED